jgi:hypothetical protein
VAAPPAKKAKPAEAISSPPKSKAGDKKKEGSVEPKDVVTEIESKDEVVVAETSKVEKSVEVEVEAAEPAEQQPEIEEQQHQEQSTSSSALVEDTGSELITQKIEVDEMESHQEEGESAELVVHVHDTMVETEPSAADLIESQMEILHQSDHTIEEQQHHEQEHQQIIILETSGGDTVQQQSAVDSILPHESEEAGGDSGHGQVQVHISDDSPAVLLGLEDPIVKDSMGESNTESSPWNEQGCIVCNIDISIEHPPASVSKNQEKIKEFFLEFFSIGDQISLDHENAFPFCQKCAEDMESLMGINHKIEFMHKQFNKVRDSLAKKAIKTFLVRTKPGCLEEDTKAETYGYMDEDQKKPYKEQMFSRMFFILLPFVITLKSV